MKSTSSIKPSKLEEVGNGAVLYHYNIAEATVPAASDNASDAQKDGASTEDDSEKKEEAKQWECEEVTVWKPITSNRITEAVITDRWPANHEQKLVNEYNAALLGVYGSKTSDTAKAKIQAYTDYLTERAALKAIVDADCQELGIE